MTTEKTPSWRVIRRYGFMGGMVGTTLHIIFILILSISSRVLPPYSALGYILNSTHNVGYEIPRYTLANVLYLLGLREELPVMEGIIIFYTFACFIVGVFVGSWYGKKVDQQMKK